MRISRKFKIIYFILIPIIVISISFSGMFTIHDGHIISEFTYNVSPYSPKTYENYTISSSNHMLFNDNASGYLSVSSSNSTSTISINIWYYNNTVKEHEERSIILEKEGNSYYYNNTIVVLPFFYHNNNVISRVGGTYQNATQEDVSDSLITQPGILQFHPGEYIYLNMETLIYENPTNLLFISGGVNLAINNLFNLYLHNNNGTESFPVGTILTLHSTNVVVFPVNWFYVVAVYVVVAISVGFIVIVPAAILLGLIAYRRRKRRKRQNE